MVVIKAQDNTLFVPSGRLLYHGTWNQELPVVLCSFTSGVSVVSFLNIAESRHDTLLVLAQLISGGNSNPARLSSLVSFYDADLVPSLVSARFGQERWDHRLQNISEEDIVRVTTRLKETLTRPDRHTSSDIDWMALIRVIVDRYSERLEITQYLINSTDHTNPKSPPDRSRQEDSDAAADYVASIYYPVQRRTAFALSTVERTGTAALNWARPVLGSVRPPIYMGCRLVS